MERRNDFRTSYGTVRYVNVKSNRKLKVAAVVGTLILVGSSIPIVSALINRNKKPEISQVPDNRVVYTIDVEANKGDTLSELALEYYNDDCDSVYNSFDNYVDDIARGNNIKDKDLIDSNTTYKLPVIIDKDNEYYVQILEKQQEINCLLKNEKWVSYVIKPGDSISALALLSSVDNNELISNTKSIIAHNGIDPNKLQYGDVIEIINPKLGELKTQLSDLQNQLEESLKVNQTQK